MITKLFEPSIQEEIVNRVMQSTYCENFLKPPQKTSMVEFNI